MHRFLTALFAAGLLASAAIADPVETPILGGTLLIEVPPGEPGKSAYQTWLDLGNTGDEQAFIDDLKGEPGADSTVAGPVNSLSIGTVDTLAAGSPATATITGEAPAQVLNLGIPQGAPGSGGGGTGAPMGPRVTMSCPGTLPITVRYIQDVKMVASEGATCITINSAGQIVQLRNVEIVGGARSVRIVRGGAHV